MGVTCKRQPNSALTHYRLQGECGAHTSPPEGNQTIVSRTLRVSFGRSVFGANASAAPPTNGCAEGFESISVAQAESDGYRPVPRLVDEFVDPKKPGNRDGLVCRRLSRRRRPQGLPGRPDNLYLWSDNTFGP